MRDATNAHAVELLGDGDRSVIIMPSGHSSPDHPVARVQYVGRPVDQVLALALSSEIRDLREMAADPRPARKSRIRKPTTTAPSEVETVADGRSSPDAPPVRTALLSESDLQRALVARSADHVDALKNLRLDDLNTNQAVIAAAAACKRTRVIYEMEDGTQIAAEYTLNDPTSYMADVYLPNGSHVYRYAPAPIPAKPVDWGVGIVKAGN
jgi:hypothetical protein